MYQWRRALQLWEEAGLKQSQNKHVRDFIKFVENNPRQDWSIYIEHCRKKHPSAIKELLPPLLACDDRLIVTNVLRLSDFKKTSERDLAKKFAKEADPGKHAYALTLLAKTGTPSIKEELVGRQAALPAHIKQLLKENQRTARRRSSTSA